MALNHLQLLPMLPLFPSFSLSLTYINPHLKHNRSYISDAMRFGLWPVKESVCVFDSWVTSYNLSKDDHCLSPVKVETES